MRRSVFSKNRFKQAGVAILGFGRAGRSVALFLGERGVPFTVYTETPVSDEIKGDYRANGVDFCVGFPKTFSQGVLMRSPGIRPDLPPIRRALSQGALLCGEADLFLSLCPATVIGISGSDGKTTTANLIAALLRAQGYHTVLGGNNGTPLLPALATLHRKDFAVVELSSFQLMTAPAPSVGVLTNLTPNHLNWHLDFEEYAAAKCRMLLGAGRAVCNAACAATLEIGRRSLHPVSWFSGTAELPFTPKTGDDFVGVRNESLLLCPGGREDSALSLSRFSLPGAHNRENLAAAVAAVLPWVEARAISQVVAHFRGVPHRMQEVSVVRGVRYINSSIDTSPTRTTAALSALSTPPIVIAGGRGKGIPLEPLAQALALRAKAVFLYGETAAEIAEGLNGRIPVWQYKRFDDAFGAAALYARAGDTVLLSPGCTAFDQFRDFEHRGERFCQLVRAVAEERK